MPPAMITFFILKYVTFLLGCVACFLLHDSFAVPIVVASALTGLVGTFIPFPKRYENHSYAAIYAGSFAGMCSSELVSGFEELAIISLIGAALYVLTKNLFEGFGGRLGSVAFVSVSLFVLAKQLVL